MEVLRTELLALVVVLSIIAGQIHCQRVGGSDTYPRFSDPRHTGGRGSQGNGEVKHHRSHPHQPHPKRQAYLFSDEKFSDANQGEEDDPVPELSPETTISPEQPSELPDDPAPHNVDFDPWLGTTRPHPVTKSRVDSSAINFSPENINPPVTPATTERQQPNSPTERQQPNSPTERQQPNSPTETVSPLEPEQWIKGRDPMRKLNLISWLIDGCLYENDAADGVDSRKVPACNLKELSEKSKTEHPSEVQTYDGFFNNLFKTDLGAVDTPLLRRVPPVYDDGVYLPATKGRINPFTASDELMTRTQETCKDNITHPCGSRTGKTALLVFFGQQLVEEILDVQRPGCPPEYFNIEIPENHTFRTGNPHKTQMPLLRSRYSQQTGQSPGNPRQQLNEITPWFDGGLVYGTAKGWADVLRTTANKTLHPRGQLASENDEGFFPVVNSIRLPMANPPPPARHCKWTQQHQLANVNRFFVLGNPRGNENAFLLTFGVVLFRWHNQIATYLDKTRPDWSGERIFNEARKWVIATHQSIVYYDWLKEWLVDGIEAYKGYDPSIDPQVEHFFQTAAMRFGHTLVTPGAYMRDYACAGCDPVPFPGLGNNPKNTYDKANYDRNNTNSSIRTCNIFWRPQEPMTMKYKSEESNNEGCDGTTKDFADIDRLLMGMASQRAEREDNMIVEDLRGNVFGPLEFSRRDLMAVNIQRGRDHGTPDYNTAREAFNLTRICSVEDFMRLNDLSTEFNVNISKIIQKMEEIHKTEANNVTAYSTKTNKNCWNNIDVWTGGILETNKNRPGPLFRAIIKDQFRRIRDADRFWFENKQWKTKRFSDPQIERIKELKVFDLLVSVTRMTATDIQRNPFGLPDKPFVDACKLTKDGIWEESQCWTPNSTNPLQEVPRRCYQLPQLHTDGVAVESCTQPGTYDYFSGSVTSYITTFISIGVVIIGIFCTVPCIAHIRKQKKSDELAKLGGNKVKKVRATMRKSGQKGRTFPAREWQGRSEGYRPVVVVLVDNSMVLDLRNHDGELLRHIDFSARSHVDVTMVPKPGSHLVLKTSNEYDCVLDFGFPLMMDDFFNNFKEKFQGKITIDEQYLHLKQALASATTKQDRQARLEQFFRSVFARAFKIEKRSERQDKVDSAIIREEIQTEITKTEFADALGMSASSKFVEKMFALVDRDSNGFISFREFLDMLVIFSKGTAEEKAKLMFDMYDIKREGRLTRDEFKEMIRSLIDAANADVELTNEKLDATVDSILTKTQLKKDSFVTLEDFQRLLSQHKETLGYAQLNFSGANVPQAPQKVRGHRDSYIQRARSTVNTVYDPQGPEVPQEPDVAASETLTTAETVKGNTWFEVHRLQVFWGTLYTLVVIAIFAERAYYYSVEREHGGLRHIAGYGVTVTRGAASVMMFCYATLLLTMCRNTITHLRETFLHHFIPFDNFVTMHKFIAVVGLIFTLIHIVGHGVNFYHISTQTATDLACLFRDFFRPTHVLPKFHYWCFQTVTGISGILLTLQAALIYTFSSNYARANAFRMFWIAHKSYPIFYILMLVHGSGRLVQDPIFYTFLIGPLVLFVLDRLITTSRKKIEIPVLRADLLPSNVTRLEFARPSGFDYKSGQWVRIACASLNSSEFHPFTLSSAPHERNLTLHIRAVGPFTANIRQIYGRTKAYSPNVYPKVFLEGPYGEGHQDWWRYEVSVLVGGGIGVTPFASILKDVANNANPRNCKKIYFLWVTRTQKQFEWLVDIIRDVENHKLIVIHIFITQTYNKFDLRTVLLYICERHFQKVSNQSLFTGLKSVTHFGRPNFPSFFKTLRKMHPRADKFGVFSCGPLPMTKTVDEACTRANNVKDANGIFQHHFENF